MVQSKHPLVTPQQQADIMSGFAETANFKQGKGICE
jgi:hypothetical protein